MPSKTFAAIASGDFIMKVARKLLLGLLLVVLVGGGWNYWSVHRHVQMMLKSWAADGRVQVWGYHRYLVVPGTVVFDLRSVSTEASAVDVDRVLLRFAETQQNRRFDTVILAYQGQAKFLLKGEYFQDVGRDFADQNPIYILRTLPENVFMTDGSPAFGTWTGGWLGVMGKQMEDLSRFHQQWFLDDLVLHGSDK